MRCVAGALAIAGALALVPAGAQARVRDYWVAAAPTTWNVSPNGRDAIRGMRVAPAPSISPRVVYRRYTRNWRRPLPNAARSSADGLTIPGPLLRARVGDR